MFCSFFQCRRQKVLSTSRQFQSVIQKLSRIGIRENDDYESRLKKTLLVLCSIPFMLAGFIWGMMYIAFGERNAGLIPLSYSVISFLSIVHFALTAQYWFFRFSQLTLILLLPFALMMTLGGFVSGSAVVIWAFIAPLGALLFEDVRRAPWWFLAFAVVIAVSGLMQPLLPSSNHLSSELQTVFFSMNIIGVGTLVFFMVFYFVRQKNIYQEKSENLLLNILPKEIAEILKNESRIIADHFEGATILFADVVNFTPMSAAMKPSELVELLNEVFSHFDTLVEKHGLEKIKTIGDCYMVAAGVPRPRADHAHVLTALALEMQQFVASRTFQGKQLQFRIGINSGNVVAGVIGRKKFIYDLWGDAVNTASRMESHGAAGAIQITRSTYELIHDDFVCEPHGTVFVKGKGEMEVWHVVKMKQS